MAGAIAELARVALRRDFRNIDPRAGAHRAGRGGPAPAAGLSAELSEQGGAALARAARRRGAARHAGHQLRRRRRDDRRRAASAAAHASSGPPASRPRRRRSGSARSSDRAGRVMVGAGSLAARAIPRSSCIGDTAHALDARRQAAAGPRAGRQAAGRLCRRAVCARGWPASPRRRRSATATSAPWPRSAAAPPSPISAGSGSTARSPGCCGALVHISFLIGFRNRLVVMLDWLWSYLTFQRGARLITGPPNSR